MNKKHPLFAKNCKKLSIFPVLLLLFAACQQKPTASAIHISLSDDKQALHFTGLDRDALNDLNRDSSDQVWQSLVPVYKMPADTDMKAYQPIQPGKYKVTDSTLVFTPDTPFVKSQTYFVRWFRYYEGKRPTDYITGRRKVGQAQFTDLIFKQ